MSDRSHLLEINLPDSPKKTSASMIGGYHSLWERVQMRKYAGKILIRVPAEVHEKLAREAFESGRSINQLCLEAILARGALKKYDPWKAIEEVRKQNRGVTPKQAQADTSRAVAEVRRRSPAA